MKKISAVLIVRDEANNINRCLTALQQVADEIIVADTGSTDNTVQRALQYTAEVYEIQWQDSFALARNQALQFATGDWILVVDADETVTDPACARTQLQQFASTNPQLVGTVKISSSAFHNSQASTASSHIARFFPRQGYRFEGAVHEQLTSLNNPVISAATGVTFAHSGYLQAPDDAGHKAHRNIKLLLAELKHKPDDDYLLYQLGRAYFTLEDYDSAIDTLEHALNCICFAQACPPTGATGPVARETLTTAIVCLGYAYINTGNTQRAVDLAATHRQLNHHGVQRADFHHFCGYLALFTNDVTGAIEHYSRSLKYGITQEDVEGTGSYASAYHLGLLAEINRQPRIAESWYQRSLQYNAGYKPTIERYIDFLIENQQPITTALTQIDHATLSEISQAKLVTLDPSATSARTFLETLGQITLQQVSAA